MTTWVYNIAVRKDDKVETDTVYTDKLLTQDDANDIAKHFACDVMVCMIGTFKVKPEEAQKNFSYFAAKPKEEEKDNAEV